MNGFERHAGYGSLRWFFHLAVAGLLALTTQAAAAAPRTVLAFGDSLTAGYGLKPGEGFAPQLETALRRAGRDVRVVNAGVSGDTTTGGRARLGWVLNGMKVKPDLAILELGANDMLRGQSPARARDNLDAMLAEFRRRGIPVVLAGMRASPNLGSAYVREFDAIYPALAKKYGVPLYPFFMNGVVLMQGLQLQDGIHPNARGVAVIVRGIAPTVAAALDKLPVAAARTAAAR